MSLKIRLSRTGKIHCPSYRVVVIQSERARDAKCIENIGNYHPLREKDQVVINEERLNYWVSVGAIPTEVVVRLAKKLNYNTLTKFEKEHKPKAKAEKKA